MFVQCTHTVHDEEGFAFVYNYTYDVKQLYITWPLKQAVFKTATYLPYSRNFSLGKLPILPRSGCGGNLHFSQWNANKFSEIMSVWGIIVLTQRPHHIVKIFLTLWTISVLLLSAIAEANAAVTAIWQEVALQQKFHLVKHFNKSALSECFPDNNFQLEQYTMQRII